MCPFGSYTDNRNGGIAVCASLALSCDLAITDSDCWHTHALPVFEDMPHCTVIDYGASQALLARNPSPPQQSYSSHMGADAQSMAVLCQVNSSGVVNGRRLTRPGIQGDPIGTSSTPFCHMRRSVVYATIYNKTMAIEYIKTVANPPRTPAA